MTTGTVSGMAKGFTIGEPVDGIVDVKCANWLGFMTYIDLHHRSSHGVYFRGQSNSSWPVDSTLYREVKRNLRADFPDWSDEQIANLAETETISLGGNLMQSFSGLLCQKQALPLTGRQAWMLGRHYGLLTPFIDWTKSPYVAAFFAFVDAVERRSVSPRKKVVIFAVSSWLFPNELLKKSADNAKLARHALKVEAAEYRNQRAVAQRAVGTYLYPQTDIESFVRETAPLNLGHQKALSRIYISHKHAEEALNHLNRMNVNYASLFPDSAGIAMHSNLNLPMIGYEGMGNWHSPPGFEGLIPKEEEEE